jgi:hypothetical protein
MLKCPNEPLRDGNRSALSKSPQKARHHMQELGPTTSHICDAKVQNVFSSIHAQSWVKSESNATGDAACM